MIILEKSMPLEWLRIHFSGRGNRVIRVAIRVPLDGQLGPVDSVFTIGTSFDLV